MAHSITKLKRVLIKIKLLTIQSLKANRNHIVSAVNNCMFMKTLKKIWNWKIDLIRKYPVWCAYAAWLEGIIIGLIIYHYFFMEKLSCCGVYG